MHGFTAKIVGDTSIRVFFYASLGRSCAEKWHSVRSSCDTFLLKGKIRLGVGLSTKSLSLSLLYRILKSEAFVPIRFFIPKIRRFIVKVSVSISSLPNIKCEAFLPSCFLFLTDFKSLSNFIWQIL